MLPPAHQLQGLPSAVSKEAVTPVRPGSHGPAVPVVRVRMHVCAFACCLERWVSSAAWVVQLLAALATFAPVCFCMCCCLLLLACKACHLLCTYRQGPPSFQAATGQLCLWCVHALHVMCIALRLGRLGCSRCWCVAQRLAALATSGSVHGMLHGARSVGVQHLTRQQHHLRALADGPRSADGVCCAARWTLRSCHNRTVTNRKGV